MSIPPTAVNGPRGRVAGLDVVRVRKDFPILQKMVHDQPLIYLDNAATTQKPQVVLDALDHYYKSDNANIHRAVHLLAERATRAYEEARVKVQRFLGAADRREIVFVRGATEAINLVAWSFGRKFVGQGDEIIITAMEHHSNIVPWQMLCEDRSATLKVIPINEDGELVLEEYERLLSPRTRLVSVVHLSNALGTINPVRKIIELAHARRVPVLLDAAQSVSHLPLDVQELDCDFLVFSGHKLYGPTGIGVLYGKASYLDQMPPYQGGGDMIKSVTLAKTTYAEPPSRFEAGTPDIAGAVGLGAAIDYVRGWGLENIAEHEDRLLRRATERLREIPGVRMIGTAADRAAVLSFVVEEPPVSSLDVGTRLDLEGVAVRTGHHCCQPAMEHFGVQSTARASFAIYNTLDEVDQFADALRAIVAEARSRARPAAPGTPEIVYPRAAAPTPQAAADTLAEDFEFFDDWNQRYEYLIDLGEGLPPLPQAFRTDANRVRGCQATVYFSLRKRPGSADVVELLGDSDADIVRGEIALLERVYSGQKAADVAGFDVEGFFARLGLDQHLSMTRRNGLASMVQRVRSFAASLAGKPEAAPRS